MGCSPLFCCLRNQSPNCVAFTGAGASIISIALLIWGLTDLEWTIIRAEAETIYIIAFVFICLSLLGLIVCLFLLNTRTTEYSKAFNKYGKIVCVAIFLMCVIAFILMLLAMILFIIDYKDWKDYTKMIDTNDDLTDEEITELLNWVLDRIDIEYKNNKIDYSETLNLKRFKKKEWAAVFVPSIISLISLVYMILVANFLYKVFEDNMSPDIVYPTTIPPNSIINPNNVSQPGIFPPNNVGPVTSPTEANNITYPVNIQQSGTNLNQ